MHKHLLNAFIAIVLIGAAVTIAQIWVQPISWVNFGKFAVTLGILALLVGFLLVVKSDFGSHKKLKDEHYID